MKILKSHLVIKNVPPELPGHGLGDIVAKVAQPIAKAIDRVSGGKTHLANCPPCKKRQEDWNKIRI